MKLALALGILAWHSLGQTVLVPVMSVGRDIGWTFEDPIYLQGKRVSQMNALTYYR